MIPRPRPTVAITGPSAARYLVDTLPAVGEGDLTRRLDDSNKDEIGKLAHGFNMFASMVHHIIKEITGYTQQVSSSADRLTVVTEETSRGADRQ